MQSNITQMNLLTQNDIGNNNRHIQSQVSILNTEMNNFDNPSQSNINVNHMKSSRQPTKKISKKINSDRSNDSVAAGSSQRVCRICLGEEEDDELICPCKCSGTMQFIHVNCLKEWLNSKKLVYNGDRVKSFFWKALECELCKTPFEH